ncbi:hypothetical protein WAI453_007217 [Rhynchosporium graminicola]|uniref:Peroxidase n=1 Tax=Rhynchosporium graminicola TaxID=2792576 RepID=A0A1E1LD80_9HELO|nr:uncharacterized protein RCO7_08190 [Rhynchosporium commune]
MLLTSFLFTAAAISAVHGLIFPEVSGVLAGNTDKLKSSIPDYGKIGTRSTPDIARRSGGSGGCPAVWTPIISELSALFNDKSVSPSQCNDDARAAIRAAFHDCGTWDNSQGETGGCDGSLITANEAFTRPENNGLQDTSTKLLALQQKYNKPASPVSVADLPQVAASVATLTCPGGPRVSTYVGRKDSSNPAPDDRLPDAHGSGQSLYELFLAKGFEAKELAALLGAHSTSKAFHQPDIPAGTPQDDTPGILDVHNYSNTLKPVAGMQPFQSDTTSQPILLSGRSSRVL